VRTATLFFFCLLGAACSGASNTLGNLVDSGTTMNGDSGSSSGGGSGGGSGGSSGGGMPEGGGTCSPTAPDGGACNSLEPEGALVPYVCLGGTIPTPIGGTIVDGKYVLTSSVYYGNPCKPPENDRDIWYICGTVWQAVQENTPGTGTAVTYWYDANVTPTGPASLSLQITCGTPTITTIMFQYDATPTTLTLYVGGGTGPGTGRVDTYTKQ
jgi:hypothetical protein